MSCVEARFRPAAIGPIADLQLFVVRSLKADILLTTHKDQSFGSLDLPTIPNPAWAQGAASRYLQAL